jgi:hypothetical protein
MSSILVSTKECSEPEFTDERQRGGSSVAVRIPAIISREASGPSKIFSAKPWILISATFLFAAVATFAGMYLCATLLNATNTPATLPHMVSDSPLKMHAAGKDDGLLVTWDPQMPAVQSAKNGVLSIDDGPRHQDIDLRAREVANGWILYRYTSNDVTFRLEIHNSEGRPIRGMIRVLDASIIARSRCHHYRKRIQQVSDWHRGNRTYLHRFPMGRGAGLERCRQLLSLERYSE